MTCPPGVQHVVFDHWYVGDFTIAFFSCPPSRPRPPGHPVTRPTRPPGHPATRPPGHPATRPPGHAHRPQPHGHTATGPPGHPAMGRAAGRPPATRPAKTNIMSCAWCSWSSSCYGGGLTQLGDVKMSSLHGSAQKSCTIDRWIDRQTDR